MKKLFFYLSVAMLGVTAASCQKEVAVENPGDGNVTITIQTPGVETKAIADGLNVDIVYYEIYKNEEGHKNSLTGTPLVHGTVEMSGKEASLSLNLLQGQEYVGLFWAQVNGKNYYNVGDLRNVTVNYPNEDNNKTLANDEERAAFCNYKTFATGQNVTVVLERPFAQINLGTSFQSLEIDYKIALEESSMTVTGVANAFNVAAMTAKTETENIVNVEFGMNTVPYAFEELETLSANDDTWAYAGMNYVLVPGDASTVNVAYSIKTDVGTLSRTVSAVPVKKNFRTNLLGNLLTEETKIEIVVDERFNTPDLEPAPIYMAAAIGGEFTLAEDITLTEPLVIQSSLVLNLGGHTLKGGKAYAAGVTGTEISAITVDKGATLTIEGEGTIQGSEYGVYVKNGNVVVKGGSITAGTSAVQVNVGTADIEGGVFSNTDATDTRYVINCIDANWKNGTAKVNITGGTFHNFNPADNVAEGAGTDFVNDGYQVVEPSADVYTVIEDSAIFAADDAAVEAALDNPAVNTIYLNAGTYTIDVYSNFDPKESLTIIGTEGTKVQFASVQVRLHQAKNFTIKNCEILHMAQKSWGMLVFSTGNSAEGVYTVSNCTFNGVGTQGIFINETVAGAVYNIENCTFDGEFGSTDGAVTIQNNHGVEFTVNVTGCTFNMQNGSHEISHHYNDSAFTLNTDVDSSKIYCKEN